MLKPNSKLALASLFAVLIVLMILNSANAQTNRPETGESGFEVGETHCAFGAFGFILLLGTLAAGLLVSGRFGRLKNFKPLPIHKLIVVIMASYLTAEFIYGLTVRNVFFLNSVHGTLGFLTVTVVWITASLNPLAVRKVIKWKRAAGMHLVLATSVLALLVIHLTYAFSLFGD